MRSDLWLALCIAAIIASFLIAAISPLSGDEELYTIAIKDVQKHGIMPYATYFGQPMFWKPPLMFAVYGVITYPLMGIIPDTVLLRIPSLLFVVLGAALFYLFIKGDLSDDKRKFATLILLISLPIFGFGPRILTDTIAFFFLMLMLYSTKMLMENERARIWIAGIAASVLGVGLSKSFTISFFAFLLALGYFTLCKRKKTPRMLKGIIIGGAAALILLWIYPAILIPSLSGNAYFSYVVDTARTIVPYGIMNMMTINLVSFFTYITLIGVVGIAIGVYSMLKSKRLEFYALWAAASLIMLGSWSILSWYFIYFVPAFAVLVAGFEWNTNIRKTALAAILISTLALSIYLPLKFFKITSDEVQVNEYIKGLGDNKTLIITRDGRGNANAAYGLKYACVVTPEISMAYLNLTTKKTKYIGVLENFSTPENIRRIAFDYENNASYPKFVDQLDINSRYIPPVARTPKGFEGDFDVIIVMSDYSKAVMDALPEYKEIYRTENGEYYALGKK